MSTSAGLPPPWVGSASTPIGLRPGGSASVQAAVNTQPDSQSLLGWATDHVRGWAVTPHRAAQAGAKSTPLTVAEPRQVRPACLPGSLLYAVFQDRGTVPRAGNERAHGTGQQGATSFYLSLPYLPPPTHCCRSAFPHLSVPRARLSLSPTAHAFVKQ